MIKRALVLIVAWIALSFTLISCETQVNISARGTIRVSIDLAPVYEMGYELTKVHMNMVHESGKEVERDLTIDEESKTAYGSVLGVDLGFWEISVELFEGETAVGSGTATVEVRMGESVRVPLDIEVVSGSLELTVFWEGELEANLISDDFESYEVGETPDPDWGDYSYSGSSYMEIVDVGNPGRGVLIVDEGYEDYVKLYKDDITPFKKGFFELDMMIMDPYGWFGARFHGDDWGPYVGIGYKEDEGRLYIYTYDMRTNSFVYLEPINTGEWHRVRVEFDLSESGYYDVYIDGTYAGQGYTGATYVDYFHVLAFSGSTCSEGYFDNLRVGYDPDSVVEGFPGNPILNTKDSGARP